MGITKRKTVWEKYNHHCAYCGKELTFAELTVDHLVPKSKRKKNANNIKNLMPACLTCNRQKNAKSVEEFKKDKKQNDKNFLFYYEKFKKKGSEIEQKIILKTITQPINISKQDIQHLKNKINSHVSMLIDEFISTLKL